MKRSFDRILERRITFVLVFFLIASLALVVRLFLMQIVRHAEFIQLAARQHGLTQELSSERGTIYVEDKDGGTIPLALNKTYKVLIVSPNQILHPEEITPVVAEAFHLDVTEVLAKISKKDDPYEILARKIEPDAADQFMERGIAGISFEDESDRIYPNGRLAANLIGFVSSNQGKESGKYGLERFYNENLSGAKGLLEGVKDASGFWIALGRRIVRPPKDGSSLVLTIDYAIQQKT